jgi:muramoyltetrapeptide carboxypeptidase
MPLTRRSLLAAASALPLASFARGVKQKPILKPKALRVGDTIALVAPASAIQNQEELDKARKNIDSLGFKAKVGAHAMDYWGYLAGTDAHRADDLNAAFQDPEVAGIICLQGGYGAGRLLDLLDFGAIRQNPKVIMGYSDITALLLAIYAQAGVGTFHGPIALSTFDDFDIQNLTRAVQTPSAAGLLGPPAAPQGSSPQPGSATLYAGRAKGRLAGGNLSLVAIASIGCSTRSGSAAR